MSVWESWAPATCYPDHCFCEGLREGLVRQPSNTWSSLAFCVAGLWMLKEWVAQRESRGFSSGQAVVFAVATFLVGATSAFYHASLSFIGQWMDVQSMYLLVLAVFAVNVDALRPERPKRFTVMYVGLNLLLGVLLVQVPTARRYAFFGVILAVVVTEIWLRRRALRGWVMNPLLGAMGVQATAFGIWGLDITHTVCEPGSLMQGHAVWHALGAVASMLLWRYYRGPVR